MKFVSFSGILVLLFVSATKISGKFLQCAGDGDFGGSPTCHWYNFDLDRSGLNKDGLPEPSSNNLTALMSVLGCGLFARQLSLTDAHKRFVDAVNATNGGLTILCPQDSAFQSFTPFYNALTEEAKLRLMLFHAVPSYETAFVLGFGKERERETLASMGGETLCLSFISNGGHWQVETESVTVWWSSSFVYNESPLAIYKIEGVLVTPGMMTLSPLVDTLLRRGDLLVQFVVVVVVAVACGTLLLKVKVSLKTLVKGTGICKGRFFLRD